MSKLILQKILEDRIADIVAQQIHPDAFVPLVFADIKQDCPEMLVAIEKCIMLQD